MRPQRRGAARPSGADSRWAGRCPMSCGFGLSVGDDRRRGRRLGRCHGWGGRAGGGLGRLGQQGRCGKGKADGQACAAQGEGGFHGQDSGKHAGQRARPGGEPAEHSIGPGLCP